MDSLNFQNGNGLCGVICLSLKGHEGVRDYVST